jgi:hypothetical protein
MKKITLFFFIVSFFFRLTAQIGGTNTFEFLNLNTSPRIIALGGYVTSVIDDDVNNGVFNPSLINPSMLDNFALNYTNYYTDIAYGDAVYCFNVGKQAFLSSIKFIDYGQFIETNELGNELGTFRAGEYVMSIGASKVFDSLFHIGVNTKVAYSSLYRLSSVGVLLDVGATYIHPNRDLTASLVVKNLGYQIVPYYRGDRESLPFEVLIGVSNRLAHMPLRWHLTFQHLETLDLGFENTNNTLLTQNYDNFGYDILRHLVLGAEFLIHKNASVFIGYNNRRRYEMIIQDRRGLVGFSAGVSFKINRFHLNYARTSNHISGPVNTFGIITNFKK